MKKIIPIVCCLLLLVACSANDEAAVLPESVTDAKVALGRVEKPLSELASGNRATLCVCWQADCPPCHEEMLALKEINADLQEEDIRVLLVTFGDLDAAVPKLIELGLDFDMVSASQDLLEALQPYITKTPAMFCCDKDGKPYGPFAIGYDGEKGDQLLKKVEALTDVD